MDVGELARMTFKINIQLRNMAAVDQMLHGVFSRVQGLKDKVLLNIANEYVNEVRSEIQNRPSVITGILLNSTRILEVGDGYVVAGSDAPHAVFWEYGRGPIIAGPGKVLHWIDPSSGKDIFVKYVGPAEGAMVFDAAAIRLEKRFADLIVKAIEGLT